MSLLSIYVYQFEPLSQPIQYNLFEDAVKARQLVMNNKNTIFKQVIEKETHFRHRGKNYSVQFIYTDDELTVFRIANQKQIKLEKKFQQEIETHEPSTRVIIYNNPNVQRIAIEQNTNAFSETVVVANILNESFSRLLRNHGLNITIKKEYYENEFWDFIKENSESIQMVRFEFDYPNLPRIRETLSEVFKSVSEDTFSTKTKFELNSGENHTLQISENDLTMRNLAKGASEGGNPITIKAKGVRRLHKTGKTTKSVEFDDLEITADNADDVKRILDI